MDEEQYGYVSIESQSIRLLRSALTQAQRHKEESNDCR